ncbi:MAG TPA: hypothetical protein VNK52_12600 [Hyphomicrobiaceae bacterium]|nr:hypothetical protein [Hyphomicrobiaceae bacterium]
MLKKVTHAVMAVALAAGLAASSVEPAEAGRGGRIAAGVAAGIITLGVLGALSSRGHAYYGPVCYEGPRECHWTGRSCYYNRWGEYVCRGGRYHCYRPTICD